MEYEINNNIEEQNIPKDWTQIKLDHYYGGLPKNWCEQQNWIYGEDYFFVITNSTPMTTEWGKFDIKRERSYNYLFKNPKHATMFMLKWL